MTAPAGSPVPPRRCSHPRASRAARPSRRLRRRWRSRHFHRQPIHPRPIPGDPPQSPAAKRRRPVCQRDKRRRAGAGAGGARHLGALVGHQRQRQTGSARHPRVGAGCAVRQQRRPTRRRDETGRACRPAWLVELDHPSRPRPRRRHGLHRDERRP